MMLSGLLFVLLPGPLQATPVAGDQDVERLQKEINRLRRDNHLLRSRIVLSYYRGATEAGIHRRITVRDGLDFYLHVAAGGWGDARPADVATVCADAAVHILKAVPLHKSLTVYLVPHRTGPETKGTIGPDGEFFVTVNVQGRRWAQLAYQFAHEMAHVIVGTADRAAPQMWFEESFAEAMSLWTLSRMGESWKTKPPYPNWSGYAGELTKYIRTVRTRRSVPADVPAWYRRNARALTAKMDDRDLNLILARLLESEFERNPSALRSMYYLRRRRNKSAPQNTMTWLLADWEANVPPELRDGPKFVRKLLQIQ